MRRNYISPEYENKLVNGTFNMLEQNSFFGSKMLEVEERIEIKNDDIIWYQRPNGEQLDLSIETSLRSYFYSSPDNKKDNHRLIIDNTQTEFQRERNTRWILEIDSNSILRNYIFASMKKFRTFEGLRKSMTLYTDVDISLSEYIMKNVINRYKFLEIELYIEYKELVNNNIKRYNNVWNPNLPNESRLNRFNLTQTLNNNLIVGFEQRPSSQFAFEYYYNLVFDRI